MFVGLMQEVDSNFCQISCSRLSKPVRVTAEMVNMGAEVKFCNSERAIGAHLAVGGG